MLHLPLEELLHFRVLVETSRGTRDELRASYVLIGGRCIRRYEMSRGIHRRGGGQRQERKGQGEDAHGDVRAAAVQIIFSETSKRLPDFETTLNT